MEDLLALFDSLPFLQESGNQRIQFTTQPIPRYEKYRIGKDTLGSPSLLISVEADIPTARPDPIVLEHLTVLHDLKCRVMQSDGNIEEEHYTIIRCLNTTRNLQVYFFRVIGPLISILGRKPSRIEISNAIDTLVELFRAMSKPARKSVQGLWAELFVIAQSSNSHSLAAAWHTLPEDRFDYNDGDQRIEVKSSSNQLRQHYFSVEQLHPPARTRVLVASLFVERIEGGTSLQELIDIVRSQVSDDPDLVLHVDQVIGLTLGENWRNGLEETFDIDLARQSYQLFDSRQIPSVNPDIPPAVREVRFKSDLSGEPPIDYGLYKDAGGIFQAVLPPDC